MKLTTVHVDERGSINLLEGDLKEYPEVTIFKTKAGLCRGGCVHHKSMEYACVIEGHIFYVIDGAGCWLSAGESIEIPKGYPHFFLSLEDSVVLEWGATPEEKKVKDPVYRKVVEDHNNGIKLINEDDYVNWN